MNRFVTFPVGFATLIVASTQLGPGSVVALWLFTVILGGNFCIMITEGIADRRRRSYAKVVESKPTPYSLVSDYVLLMGASLDDR